MVAFDFCNALWVRARVGSGTITAIYYYYYRKSKNIVGVDRVEWEELFASCNGKVQKYLRPTML